MSLSAKIILFLSVLHFGSPAFSTKECTGIFSVNAKIKNIPPTLKTSLRALAEFRINLDLRKINGKTSLDQTALESNYVNKENELFNYIVASAPMTRTEFVTEIKREILNLQNTKRDSDPKEKSRIKAEKQLRDVFISDGRHGIFHLIKPGTFDMETGINPLSSPIQTERVQVTLTKPFTMMSTLTTQTIWKKLILLADIKSNFLDTDPSTYKGETNPVENISLADIGVWIDTLNKLSKKGVPGLADLFPGHKAGDIYRLPTEAEWLFVITGRGKIKDRFYFGSDTTLINDYAWHRGNASDSTQPVAQKKPLMIDGNDFYDLIGNVSEILGDAYSETLKGGVDPIVKKGEAHGVTRGGSFLDAPEQQTSLWRFRVYISALEDHRGFRLVREVRP